jgi:hypothetical protein
MVYNDMDTPYPNKYYVSKGCKEHGISLNLDKCVFMVFSGMILGFIVLKERKPPNPKKI